MNPRSLRFRMTAWYAGLLAGALLLFGAPVYLGLEHYLDSTAEIKVTTEEGKGSSFRVELPMLKLPFKDHALHNGVAF